MKLPPLVFLVVLVHAQDPLKTLPKNYRLVLQNDAVRVIHVSYAPKEKLPVHNHSAKPTVYIYLSDSGPVRFSHIEEPAFTLVRPAEKLGMFRFSPGRLEKHEVENLGSIPSEFLRVELTQLPLGYERKAFRSPESFDLTHGGVHTEFNTPSIKIQRIVAIVNDPADLQPADSPSLLVAFSPAVIQSPETHNLQCGDVLWIEANRIVHAKGHLLRLEVKPKT